MHFAVVPAKEEIYPGGGPFQRVVAGRDRGGGKGNMPDNSLELFVDLDPVALFFAGENFAEAVNTATAWTIYHFFRAAGLVAEKSAGIEHTVPAHGTSVKEALGEKLLQPQKPVPVFFAVAETAELTG